jgi:hypothetical protein
MSDRSHELRPSSGQPPDANWEAIARHLAGESDPVEAASVRSWLATHAEDARLVDLVKVHTANAEHRADVTVDTERALAAVHARMGVEATAPRLSVERGGSPGRANVSVGQPARRRWSWVAGALAAGVAAMAALSQFRSTSEANTARPWGSAIACGCPTAARWFWRREVAWWWPPRTVSRRATWSWMARPTSM